MIPRVPVATDRSKKSLRALRALLQDPVRKFQLALLVLLLLAVLGTTGYMLLEGMRPIDAVYMTVITLATVGYGEVQPLSEAGRVFTSAFILLGVGTSAWAISAGVEVLLGENLWNSVRKRKMEEKLESIANHYIVCGYGRMGRQIVRDLIAREESFLVIEQAADREQDLLEEGITHILGDATQDETLERAHIDRARGFVAALSDDAKNVLAVLTARGLNPHLLIVARASMELSENKLRRAGADRVVSPYAIGGHRLALALLQPAAHDFMSQLFEVEDRDADIGEIRIREDSPLNGLTIAESDLRGRYNLAILAIRDVTNRRFVISPDPGHRLGVGETLVVIGSPRAIIELEHER